MHFVGIVPALVAATLISTKVAERQPASLARCDSVPTRDSQSYSEYARIYDEWDELFTGASAPHGFFDGLVFSGYSPTNEAWSAADYAIITIGVANHEVIALVVADPECSFARLILVELSPIYGRSGKEAMVNTARYARREVVTEMSLSLDASRRLVEWAHGSHEFTSSDPECHTTLRGGLGVLVVTHVDAEYRATPCLSSWKHRPFQGFVEVCLAMLGFTLESLRSFDDRWVPRPR